MAVPLAECLPSMPFASGVLRLKACATSLRWFNFKFVVGISVIIIFVCVRGGGGGGGGCIYMCAVKYLSTPSEVGRQFERDYSLQLRISAALEVSSRFCVK